MIKVRKGSIITTESGIRYILAYICKRYYLISLSSGNRWSDVSIELKHQDDNGLFTTLEELNEEWPYFRGIMVESGKEVEKVKKIKPLKKQINTIEMERVLALSIAKLDPNGSPYSLIRRLTKDLGEFLKEKDITEVIK